MNLFDNLQNIPSLNELKGNFGEQLAKFYSKFTTDALILHDILIDGSNDLTSQIDLLMIEKTGIYVVEVKMFDDAVIYGDGKKNTWFYYRNSKKYDIYSPLKQNKKHIEYLKAFLSDFGTIPFFSVLFICCKDFKISNINENPDAPTTVVCNSLPSMTKGIRLLSKDKHNVLSAEQQQKIYDYITERQYSGKDYRKTHKEQVIAIKKEYQNAKDNSICPYCKAPLVLRKGKFGDFYGCSNYPKCRYTQKL